jgi:hypothetical protein
MFIPIAMLTRVRPFLAPAFLATSGVSQILLRSYYFIDDKYTAESYLFFVFGLCVLWAYSRPFSVERLKAWWEGKPEPRAPAPTASPKPAATSS